jgi:hypothetical protein
MKFFIANLFVIPFASGSIHGDEGARLRLPACFLGLVERSSFEMFGDSRSGYRLGNALYHNKAFSQILG